MKKATDWPVHYKDQLALGNPRSPVGVATLWTLKEEILRNLDDSLYAAAGQLYSKEGINWIIRNVLANPRLRYLVLCGDDRSQSGEALIDFWEGGVDEKSRTCRLGVRIDEEIDRGALETIRKNVDIVDLRSVLDGGKVAAKVQSLDLKKSPFGEPLIFPIKEREAADIFPSDPSVLKLRYPTVAVCWPRILKAIMKFGCQKGTDYGGTQRELLNLCAVIHDDDPDNLCFADYFPFSREEFEKYAPQILTPDKIPGLEYTYGERLRAYDGIDQIKGLVDELKRNPDSRRALAVTWKVRQDMAGKQPPCVILVQGLIQRGLLHLAAFIRSNDMFRAWPQNALALRRLQGIVAKETGFKVGVLTVISGSAHIYERDYGAAQEIIDGQTQGLKCEFDPRGNFVIKVEDGLIKVIHQSPEGERLQEYQGKSAMELCLRLDEDMIVSQIGHAFDLGFELGKAETMLRLGKKYRQDTPLIKLL